MINTRFWIDDYIANLDPVEKLLFLYLLTNPSTDICGVYELPTKNMALDTGLDREMVLKILSRFSRDKKVYYHKGWVGIVNFIKHQSLNPKVMEGIKNGLNKAPKELIDRLSIGYDSLSHLNLNSNSNLNSNLKSAEASSATWNLEEKLSNMETIPNSYLDIIASFIREKPVPIENAKQLSAVISRYSRVAQKLSGAYTNKQIFEAADKIRQNNKRLASKGDEVDWTLETILKTLTK